MGKLNNCIYLFGFYQLSYPVFNTLFIYTTINTEKRITIPLTRKESANYIIKPTINGLLSRGLPKESEEHLHLIFPELVSMS